MGFAQDSVTKEWVRVGQEVEEIQMAEEVRIPQGDEEPVSMASMMEVLRRIEANQVDMRTTLVNVDTRLRRIEKRVETDYESLDEEGEEDDEEEEDGDDNDGMEP